MPANRDPQHVEETLLASAVRTADTVSGSQLNWASRGLAVFVDVTARSGSTAIQPGIDVKDPVSDKWFRAWTGAASAINSASSLYAFEMYPGASSAGNLFTDVIDMVLPRTWRIAMNHDDSGSITYSVGICRLV